MTVTAQRSPARLRAARVLRAHGVRGEVRAEPCGGDAARFLAGLRMWVEDTATVLTVRAARTGSGGSVLLAFEEIADADAARALHGAYLCVDTAAARRLGDDEWFVWQLVGLRAITPQGAELGEVIDVDVAVGNDILVVRGPEGTRMFPMVRDFIADVSTARGTVTITPWQEDKA